ncbi:MAG: hypothetical protein EA406_01900 [Rhodospirillales bacterium]|nr:MAG: hypothetical protein EA406_01900 [Rhodospirillales bacterium]
MRKPILLTMTLVALLLPPAGAHADTQVVRLFHGTGLKADKIVVHKSERRLKLMRNGAIFRIYPIDLGFSPTGHKVREGDGRTPEGTYYIDWRNPGSQFHLSLRISYPNAEDEAKADALGVRPGGMIMIHGQPNYANPRRPKQDWTEGCIAVSNADMEEIWHAVDDGTLIEIRP